MRFLLTLTLLFVIVLNSFSVVAASVSINEFSSHERYVDWVELYSDAEVDLKGYKLTHLTTQGEESNIEKYENSLVFGPGTSEGSYLVVDANDTLNIDGDRIRLYDPDGILVSDIYYGDKGGPCPPNTGQSVGSITDGRNDIEFFDRFETPTEDGTNNNATLAPCPAPNTPTNTPTPTTKPTNTATPTNTPTPKPTSTPTKKMTSTPTSKVLAGESEEYFDDSNLEDTRASLNGEDTDNDSNGGEGNKSKFPLTAGLLIFAGLIFMGTALYPFLKPFLKRYNLKIGKKRRR